jgi:hypothetical protein
MTVVRDELESVLEASAWFPSAPFKSIGLIIRFGINTNLTPIFQGIHKLSGELQVGVELDMAQLRSTHREPGKLESMVRDAICEVLCSVAAKYEFSKHALDEYISHHGDAEQIVGREPR